jgi:hypothetical protein
VFVFSIVAVVLLLISRIRICPHVTLWHTLTGLSCSKFVLGEWMMKLEDLQRTE